MGQEARNILLAELQVNAPHWSKRHHHPVLQIRALHGETLHSSIALQKSTSMREATAFNFPNVQCILDTLVAVWRQQPQRENFFLPRSKLRATPKRTVENSESKRLESKMHQAAVNVFFQLSGVFGNTCDERRNRQVLAWCVLTYV